LKQLCKHALGGLVFCIIPGLSLSPAAFTATAPQASDLQKIDSEIQTTRQRLQFSQKQHNELMANLETSELELGRIETEKNALEKAVTAQQEELEKLQQQEQQLLAAKSEQEKNIAAQINASYRLGHEKNVRVILNQQDSRAVSRSLVYSDYITKARLAALKNFEDTLHQLADNKTAINQKTAELLASQSTLADKAAKAKLSFTERNQALQALQASIKTDEARIAQLRDEQNRMQELLRQIRAQQIAAQKAATEKARIEQAAREKNRREREQAAQKTASPSLSPSTEKTVASPGLPANLPPFAQSRGKLRWPVQGKMDNRYGQKRQPGDFRWDGISFIAAAGTEIKAVHGGKVVFADWFRGKGLLLIIDHGDGYMTLYAHNQTLLKKSGEQVNPGDVIGTVGNSGGLAAPELYFELRYQGEPVNPGNWFINKG
jgi:septal ring factor EnvC (AmiA/AmiB activator)